MDELEIENDPHIEEKGIIAAIETADAHWQQLINFQKSNLNLIFKLASTLRVPVDPEEFSQFITTEMGDSSAISEEFRLYISFRSNFPRLPVNVLYDDDLKNAESGVKQQWQDFMVATEGRVPQYNQITLLRSNARSEYAQDNTMIVPRIQFACIEVTRTIELSNLLTSDPERTELYYQFLTRYKNND
jgi:hypothetical protein